MDVDEGIGQRDRLKREAARLRSRGYWEARRARGQCAATGCKRTPEINPSTGAEFWRCRSCRLAGR